MAITKSQIRKMNYIVRFFAYLFFRFYNAKENPKMMLIDFHHDFILFSTVLQLIYVMTSHNFAMRSYEKSVIYWK